MSKKQKPNKTKQENIQTMSCIQNATAETEISKDDLFSDIIANIDTYSDILSSKLELAEFLKNTDQAEILWLVENMKWDNDIFTSLREVKTEMKNVNWDVIPFDDSAKSIADAEFVEEQLEKHWSRLIDIAAESIAYGYTVAYYNWEIEKGKWIISEVNDLGPQHFRFTPDGRLYLYDDFCVGDTTYPSNTILNQFEGLGRLKLMVAQHGVTGNNWYGWAEVIICYYLWSFKNLSYQQWALFIKKVAIPSFIALFTAQQDGETVTAKAAELAKTLRQMRSGSGGAMANVDEIVKLDPGVGANDSYPQFIDVVSKSIQKVLKGSFLTSDTAKTGSYTTSEKHKQTIQLLALSHMEEFAATLQKTFIYALMSVNKRATTNLNMPKLKVYLKQVADWEKIRDSLDRGIPIKKSALKEDYAIPIADDDDDENDIIQINQDTQNNEQTLSNFFFQTKKQ